MGYSVEKILAYAKTKGASDVHITVGIPPKMRVNGKLIAMSDTRLLPQDTLEMALNIMNDSKGHTLRKKVRSICLLQ